MEKIRVSRTFNFSAAHSLPDYDGDCSQLHGHNYKVIITVSLPANLLNETGMVVDFKDMKNLGDKVIHIFDHKNLNDIIKNPTAENIALLIYALIKKEFILAEVYVDLHSVEVFESEFTSACVYYEKHSEPEYTEVQE